MTSQSRATPTHSTFPRFMELLRSVPLKHGYRVVTNRLDMKDWITIARERTDSRFVVASLLVSHFQN